MARLLKGLRQRDLAALAGVDQGLVSRAETGDPRVSVRTKKKIAAALDLSVASLFTEPKEGRP